VIRKGALEGMTLPGKLRIVQVKIQQTQNSILSREILQEVLQNKDVIESIKLFFHFEEKYSIPNKHVSIRYFQVNKLKT